MLEEKCDICGLGIIWNKKPLVLQLDHINGNTLDDRIENLRLLCPNCHSQTRTYCGKEQKEKKLLEKFDKAVLEELLEKNDLDTVKNILKTSSYFLSKLIKKFGIKYKCKRKPPQVVRKFEISKEELEKLIKEKPYEQIGKMFNVTGNAIKKRCKILGIELPKNRRGYWAKVYAGKIKIDKSLNSSNETLVDLFP
jgi:hypothetical protein